MRRMKAIIGLLAVMTMLIVGSAAPAMAKGNGVKEEKNETLRQQAQEENHFNNFDGCFDFNCGVDNFVFNGDGLFGDDFLDDFGDDDFENQDFHINCPVVGVIVDNGSSFNNNSCGTPFVL